ncbi:MAG: ParB/RepB/Spo0J family partition protein [Planctomycetota bacterium]|jgi:ParB family chromosome partitioning protein
MATRRETTNPGRRRLGRGLGSLLASPVAVEPPPIATTQAADAPPTATSEPPPGPAADAPAPPPSDADDRSLVVTAIGVEQIVPNPHQPRQRFDETSLRMLGDSIRTAGLMQPIVVRPSAAGGFELIAGERRWRAAQQVGLTSIPAVVKDLDDKTAAEWALVENLQREDLNPIERAEAFQRLARDFGLTHQQIAEAVGLDRTTVSNHLRLLELDPFTREAVENGALNIGHAKALLAITNIERRHELAAGTIRGGWSVREVERRSRQKPRPATSEPRELPPNLEDLQRRLGEHLGTKVHLQVGRKKGTGRVTIEFYDLDHFEGLMRKLDFDPSE